MKHVNQKNYFGDVIGTSISCKFIVSKESLKQGRGNKRRRSKEKAASECQYLL